MPFEILEFIVKLENISLLLHMFVTIVWQCKGKLYLQLFIDIQMFFFLIQVSAPKHNYQSGSWKTVNFNMSNPNCVKMHRYHITVHIFTLSDFLIMMMVIWDRKAGIIFN